MRVYLAVILALFVGVLGYWLCDWQSYANRERPLAMEWGDNSSRPTPLGAKVTLEPEAHGYSVHAIVLMSSEGIDGDIFRFHDFGKIAHVASAEEAARKFGKIEWRKDGLHIGPFFGRRDIIEHDR